MGATIVAPIPALRRLRAGVGGLGGQAYQNGCSAAVGAAALRELQRSFQQGVDPYDRPWAPLSHPSKRRGGASAKPLMDRRILFNSFAQYGVPPVPGGFRMGTNVVYAGPHQYGATMQPHSRLGAQERLQHLGTGRFIGLAEAKRRKLKAVGVVKWSRTTYMNGWTLPRRQFMPEVATGGVGPRWGHAMNKAASSFMRDWFQRGGE